MPSGCVFSDLAAKEQAVTFPSKTVGVVGLGLMGSALTERLLEHGYRVHVWNRSRDKSEPLVKFGAVWSDNPLRDCDRVIVSLYTTDVVEEVLGQLSGGLHAGLMLIDTTTGEPQQTASLAAKLLSQEVKYLDAPISGSSAQTRRGDVTIMVGGSTADFTACADLWSVLSAKTFHCGPCGSAATMKLVSNLVLGLNRAALAEGLAFAQTLGLDLRATLDVLRGSMAASRIMDTKGHKMIARDYSVQAKLSQHLKDLHLMLDAAEARGLSLPLTSTHAGLLKLAENAGLGEADNSAVFEAYRVLG